MKPLIMRKYCLGYLLNSSWGSLIALDSQLKDAVVHIFCVSVSECYIVLEHNFIITIPLF